MLLQKMIGNVLNRNVGRRLVAGGAGGSRSRSKSRSRSRSRGRPFSTMMKAVQVLEAGDSSKLLLRDVEKPKCQPGCVVVRNELAGLNFIDTYHRNGLYPVDMTNGFTLGVEGAGTLEEIGQGVDPTWFENSKRVCFFGSKTYAEFSLVPAEQVVAIPDQVGSDEAIALITQGMTAHYLAKSTFPLQKGNVALIHAAAGGTGQLLVQIAKLSGATVIGTSSKSKLDLGKRMGADHMICYDNLSDEKFVSQVLELTDGKGVDVAYDGVGAKTFQNSLNSIKPRGMCVLFGNASGPVPPIDPLELTARGSLFLTRPKLYDYLSSREEFLSRCNDLFNWVQEGRLNITIQAEFALENAKEAHDFIESGSSKGKIIIKI